MHRQFQRVSGHTWRSKHLVLLLFILPLATFYVLVNRGALHAQLPTSFAPSSPNKPGVILETIDPQILGLNNRKPTKKFRDNLRNDSYYITSWSSAGFTNQFIGYVNMIYLSTLTNRIPIIPPFAPDHHISMSAGILPFGDIFNLDALREQLRIPILEWRDVKDLTPKEQDNPWSTADVEELGCWTTRKENEREPIRAENVVNHLGVDVSYTRVPTYTRVHPSDGEDDHIVFSQLASVMYPLHPRVDPTKLRLLAPSPHGRHLAPDQHMSCIDTMYYATSGADVYEWRFSWSPAWRTIGQHLLFTENLKELGREYLRRVFHVEGQGEELPPFIAVHIRRGDFSQYCRKIDGHVQDCMLNPTKVKEYVEEVQTALLEERHISVSKVVVMSDETSPLFWDEVRNQAWYHVDHTKENTLDLYGEWYLPLIESVIQSFAVGFVGTEGSTYSLVSQRRVEDWNRGITRSLEHD